MNKVSIIFTLVVVGCILALSLVPDSEAKLWDFIIDVEFLKNPISEEKTTIIHGTVVDHAYRPVYDVDVKITYAGESHILKTDSLGEFEKQFDVSELKPRTYSVQISATTDDGKKGMTRTTFQIEGHTEKSAKYERQLESLELANDPSKLRKNSSDPISVILYEHYLKLQHKALQVQHKEKSLNDSQQKIKEIRELSNQKLMKILEERPLPSRQFDDSHKLAVFLDALDDDKRNIFELQLNSTKLRSIGAQNLMQDLLANGTSQEKARQAYLDYLSITQEQMNSVTENIEKTEISSKPTTNSTKN